MSTFLANVVHKYTRNWLNVFDFGLLGPVVQSVVSLTKSLVNDSLSLLVCLKTSVLILFAEKM